MKEEQKIIVETKTLKVFKYNENLYNIVSKDCEKDTTLIHKDIIEEMIELLIKLKAPNQPKNPNQRNNKCDNDLNN